MRAGSSASNRSQGATPHREPGASQAPVPSPRSRVEDEGYGFAREVNRLAVYHRIVEFWQKHTGG